MAPFSVQFDRGPGGRPARFSGAARIWRARTGAEAMAALAEAEAALSTGRWIAGCLAYELGYLLEPGLAALLPARRRLPLLVLGAFDGPGPPAPPAAPGRLSPFEPVWDRAAYAAAFGRVMDYIRAGDIYQANLTMPLAARWSGAASGLYAALAARQPVPHGALVEDDEVALLCRSPELFFALDGRGGVEARPMKGTAPRNPDPERDRAAREALARDEKNRAENLMIVDLLRNDIGRIAEIGSVRAPALFEVETYATVHQMTSRVTGCLRPGVGLAGVIAALFPCGSVTGTPKIRAMEIIRALEAGPREAYCGAIGWASPDGRAAFAVPIRTIALYPGGEASLHVGSAVVADSTAAAEYEEALWKARFAALPPRG